MVHRYYWSFAKADSTHALEYICLLSMSSAELPQNLQKELRSIIADYVKELVVESKAYSALLGTMDAQGQKTVSSPSLHVRIFASFSYCMQSGAIVQHSSLLMVEDERRFIQSLVQAVVGSVDSDTKFNDSILLFNIAEDYNAVIDVVNSELGACISRHSTLPGSELLQIAKSIMDHYQSNGVRLERQRTDTLSRLIKLNEALEWIEAGRLDDALVVGFSLSCYAAENSRFALSNKQSMESAHVIPLDASGDVVSIMRAAEEFKDLDEAIIRNFDAILLAVMNVLYMLYMQLKESPYGDNSRQHVCLFFFLASF